MNPNASNDDKNDESRTPADSSKEKDNTDAAVSAPGSADATVPGSTVASTAIASAAEKKKISGLLHTSAIRDVTTTRSAIRNKSLGNQSITSKHLRFSRNTKSKVNGHVSSVNPAPGSVTHEELESQTDNNRISRIGAIRTSHSDHELDNLEGGEVLLEAVLVPPEQDIPHATVHPVDDKDERQQQEQREEERKRRRGRMVFKIALILLAVGAILAISLSLGNPTPPPQSPTTPPTSVQIVAPGSLASDMTCSLSLECAKSCCSNSYSTSDGISKCIPVEADNSTACIDSDSPPMSPVDDTPASTAGLPYVGSYWLTWGDGVNEQEDPNENFSIAFSGWSDINTALTEGETRYPNLRGEKYIAVGGSTNEGRWSEDALLKLATATQSGLRESYNGILYSIIIGDSGLAQHFLDSFALAKSNGLKVIVVVSDSAPHSIVDGATLMAAFLNDGNIDVISPLLFESGSETGNRYIETNGVSWSNYTNARPAIVPSLVRGGAYFTDAKNFFSKEYGIDIQGYIRWSQT